MSDVVKLTKGENVNLTKDASGADTGLTKVVAGLGWDTNSGSGAAFDLDASAVLLNAEGKVRNDKDFIYFGNLKSTDNSVEHTGDNLTGEGDGDDEQIAVDLAALPADVEKVQLIVNIYSAASRNQNFGQVSNAFVRLFNPADDSELVRYDLTEDYSGKTSITVAELYRNGADWKFKALGQGNNDEVAAVVRALGVNA